MARHPSCVQKRTIKLDFISDGETKILVTGGGSANMSILQIIADVFNAPVFTQVSEYWPFFSETAFCSGLVMCSAYTMSQLQWLLPFCPRGASAASCPICLFFYYIHILYCRRRPGIRLLLGPPWEPCMLPLDHPSAHLLNLPGRRNSGWMWEIILWCLIRMPSRYGNFFNVTTFGEKVS